MASITLRERALVKRLDELHEMFAPLRQGKQRVAIRFAKDSPSGTKALVATDQRPGDLRYREASFSTSVDVLRCKYFEIWRAANGKELVLVQAYFTLQRVKQAARDFDDLLCIHTDPLDTVELKQGPHLHVSCAEDPIRHCHFPFDLGSLSMVLKDCDSLTSAMRRALGVVAIDVLPKFLPK